jgi:hypothetical protein
MSIEVSAMKLFSMERMEPKEMSCYILCPQLQSWKYHVWDSPVVHRGLSLQNSFQINYNNRKKEMSSEEG